MERTKARRTSKFCATSVIKVSIWNLDKEEVEYQTTCLKMGSNGCALIAKKSLPSKFIEAEKFSAKDAKNEG